MYNRDNLHTKAVKSSSPELYAEYKRCRNRVVKMIRKAKRDYYTEQVKDSKCSKQMWKTLKHLTKSNTAKEAPIHPNVFNEFFSSIGSKYNEKFPKSDDLHWTQSECVHTFKFSDIQEDQLLKYLTALPDYSSLDVLGFDSKLIRCGAETLVSSLTVLFNMSLRLSSLPKDLKRARVTPVYKGKGSKSDPSSYRPISVIHHVAKLLEKCIQCQLMSYLEYFKLITFNQSAFMKGHSTQTAVHNMFDDVLDSVNDGLISGACFFDLAKCFDTIDHSLLLKKLRKYGILVLELAWF